MYSQTFLFKNIFSSKNFSLKPDMVSLKRTKSSAYKIPDIEFFLAFSVIASITIENSNGDKTDP